MDDNELDRLFGKDGEAEEKASEDSAEVTDTKSVEEEVSEKEPSDESADEEDVTEDEESGSEEKETGEPAEEEIVEEEFVSAEEEEQVPEKEEAEPEIKAVKSETPKKKPAKAPVKKAGKTVRLNRRGIAAICIVLALITMVMLVLFLPAFRVRNAHVEGNVVLTDEEILKEVGLEYDAHLMSGISGNIIDILRLDYGKTEERIKKENPYIEDIRITIKLPSTVYIEVKERSKICYISTPDGYAALDKNGIVLELSSFDSLGKAQPVICGLNVTSAELGKPVCISNENDYKKAIIVLGAILAADNASVGGDYSMFENTQEVRILPSGYIFLTIASPSGHTIQIKLDGLETISDDMAWLLYLFNADAFDKITVDGALDMTGDEYIFD